MTRKEISELLGLSKSIVRHRITDGKSQKEYDKRNKEKIRLRKKLWGQNNPDKIIEYKDRHRDKKREYNKVWREQNKEKALEQEREYRLANREKLNQYNVEWNGKNRQRLSQKRLELKTKCTDYLGGKCSSCGETEVLLLEFHHTDRGIKEFTISDQIYRRSLEELVPELDKCVLLCGNCHRKQHRKDYESESKHTAYLRRKKERLLKLRGNKCSICGYDEVSDALEFHHIDPESKKGQVQNMRINDAISEIEKCELLCCNCHKKAHKNNE